MNKDIEILKLALGAIYKQAKIGDQQAYFQLLKDCETQAISEIPINKTAKEMFKELGYVCEKGEIMINYTLDNDKFTMIQFNTKEKYFRKRIYMSDTANINTQENKAIEQQIKELGW